MNLKKAAQKKLRKSGGFTLVEMLIVVAIIAILVVVSIPMVSSSLDKARTATDDANMRAAKSAALVDYMMGDPVAAGTSAKYYYKAADGSVERNDTSVPTGLTGYNQAKQETTIEKGNGVVEVTITEPNAAGTTDYTVSAKWVSVSS